MQHSGKRDGVIEGQHFNKLTPAEAERLALLAEECAEVVQIVGKILRHGYQSHHPENPTQSNKSTLTKECGDVLAAVALMVANGDMTTNSLMYWQNTKLGKVGYWLHHQKFIPKEPVLFGYTMQTIEESVKEVLQKNNTTAIDF